MDRRSKNESAATDQHARFLKTARALGCDENEAAFNEELKRLAQALHYEVKEEGINCTGCEEKP